MNTVAFIFVALLNPASAPTKKPAQDKTVAQSAVVERGAALTLKKSITMDELAANAEKFSGKTVQVKGKVATVCKKKGCWMGLAGDKITSRARVTFKDYAFFVPLDSQGSKAVVEGSVKAKVMSTAERQHLADDAGKPLSEIPKSELRIVATGVKLYP